MDCEESDLVMMWLAGLLANPTVWRCGLSWHSGEFDHPELLAVLGLNRPEILARREPPAELSELFQQYVRQNPYRDDPIYCNLERLGARLGLVPLELRVLTLLLVMPNNSLLERTSEFVSRPTRRQCIRLIAELVEADAVEVERLLRADSNLHGTGLLESDSAPSFQFTDWVTVNPDLAALACQRGVSEERLMSLFYRSAEPRTLEREDFQHIDVDMQLLLGLLEDGYRAHRRGVNVLIHGPPGTGKTELCGLLAEELGKSLALVADTDAEGDRIEPDRRLDRFTGCQRALRQNPDYLVLFDEAEDTLCDQGFGFFGVRSRRVAKATLTRMLEQNEQPILWVSNRIDMDPALLRRFDYVLRLDVPGPAHRRRILERHTRSLPVSDDWRRAVVEIPELSPALIANAAEVARRVSNGEGDFQPALTRTLEGHLDALGCDTRITPKPTAELPWRKEVLNADTDMAALLGEVDPDASARFCLYGPPGTGKTAWAHQLAERLERPLVIKQAAELQSKWVGESEKNIARAFREAERDGAVLLIDEADSFLDDRSYANASWQISQVNQFLASLENFQGMFVATTNFMDRLDNAAMRRFDFRVRFDYMSPDAAVQLFEDLAALHGIALPDTRHAAELLRGIDKLTPGDYAAITRRLSVRKALPDAKGLAELLRAEVAYKSRGERSIGFTAAIG